MAAILKEISVITGQFTNGQGQTKNRYQRIGSIIDTKNGEMLKLDTIPLKEGGWDGWAFINDPRPKEPKEQKFQGLPQDDDMPF